MSYAKKDKKMLEKGADQTVKNDRNKFLHSSTTQKGPNGAKIRPRYNTIATSILGTGPNDTTV